MELEQTQKGNDSPLINEDAQWEIEHSQSDDDYDSFFEVEK